MHAARVLIDDFPGLDEKRALWPSDTDPRKFHGHPRVVANDSTVLS
jgi:hypothetical protein